MRQVLQTEWPEYNGLAGVAMRLSHLLSLSFKGGAGVLVTSVVPQGIHLPTLQDGCVAVLRLIKHFEIFKLIKC